jgi:hypothetical protein
MTLTQIWGTPSTTAQLKALTTTTQPTSYLPTEPSKQASWKRRE